MFLLKISYFFDFIIFKIFKIPKIFMSIKQKKKASVNQLIGLDLFYLHRAVIYQSPIFQSVIPKRVFIYKALFPVHVTPFKFTRAIYCKFCDQVWMILDFFGFENFENFRKFLGNLGIIGFRGMIRCGLITQIKVLGHMTEIAR